MDRPRTDAVDDPLEGYVRPTADTAWWLAGVDDASAIAPPGQSAPQTGTFAPLAIGPLGRTGTVPLASIDHDRTAWFYGKNAFVSDAVPGAEPMTADELHWFVSDRANLRTYEKRAVLDRGKVLRVWPRRSPRKGRFVLLTPPTATEVSVRPKGVDGLVLETGALLRPALRDAIITSARLDDTVVLACVVAESSLL